MQPHEHDYTAFSGTYNQETYEEGRLEKCSICGAIRYMEIPEQIPVYNVVFDYLDKAYICRTLEDLTDLLEDALPVEDSDEGTVAIITIKLMTQDELDALPDSDEET
ncbi:MAG: hypothetical protein KF716_14890 [Anaerolineae bacterium]|nr:hypothetical protein [Anaerolineae bacterium]